MFNAVHALLTEKGLEPSTHRGTIRMFGKHFVKDGPLPEKVGRALHHGYDLREIGDYEGLIEVDEEESRILLDEATDLVDRVEQHLRDDAP